MSDDGTDRVLAQLAAARALCEQLGRTTQLRVEVPEEDAEKAAFLDQQGRPFFDVTPELSDAVCRAMQDKIEDVFTGGEGHAAVAEIFAEGARAAREHFLARFDKQGADVTLRPLAPGYLKWKAAHGFVTLVGIKTKQLRDSVAGARITFT